MIDSNKPVVTRFAPSPTGALHVGGARTALFCWAFARRHGGQFLLRIEDTDVKRSSDASAQGILDDLRWLGIHWDNDPIPYQSKRLDIYNEHIERLLKSGHAYAPADEPGVVRFRMGRDVTFDDAVFGHIEVKAADLEDFVIRKGEAGGGFPTFHFAVVVDDALMNVTHVIRGQEHLSNTPKHVALQEALGFPRPVYAHTPSIMNPDGSKMSKRDKAKAARAAAKAQAVASVGFDDERFAAFLDKKNDDIDLALAVAKSLGLALPEIEVADFRRSGYLPDALLNYLALLGWNPGNNVERFDLDFLKQNFSLERIGKSNAKFDRDKLFRFNADSIAQLAPEDFARRLRDHFEAQHPAFVRKLDSQAFATFAECYRPRARTLSEPAELGRFFITDDSAVVFDAKAVDKVLAKGDGFAVLAALKPVLEACDWNSHAIEAAVKQFAEGRQLGLGKVAQPLRVAVTGNTVSPSIGDTLALLGKASTMARIDRCLQLQPA